jgi:hypothetical protein
MATITYDYNPTRDAIREMNAIKAAETTVAPIVGPVLGMDSEFDVYATALLRLGHDTRGLGRSAVAAKVAFDLAWRSSRPRKLAMDAKQEADYATRFPGASKLKVRNGF